MATFEFELVRRTECIERQIVHVDANDSEHATKLIRAGGGDYKCLNSDEIIDAEIIAINLRSVVKDA